MKKMLLLLSMMAAAVGSQAGGLLHNTNQHIAFVRMMARGASHEIDAVYTNPAGIAFMDHDGWALSLNIQSAYQTRNIDATVMTPSGLGLFPNDTYNKKYKGDAAAPILPSVYAVYKTPKWAVSGFVGVVGGGGKCSFDDGLPLFDAAVMAGTYLGTSALAPYLGGPVSPDQYYIDGYMRGRQYIFGAQLGFSYKFNKHFSGYAGFRANYFSGNYKGYVKATAHQDLAAKLQAIGAATGNQQLVDMAGENGIAHIALNCDQTGWGITPILGVNFKWKGLTVAAKYEFKTNLNIENDAKEEPIARPEQYKSAIEPYKHGVNTPNDIPSVLYAAVGYEFIPHKLRGTVEYHYYDDRHADMAGGKNKELKHGTHEILAGVEWDINKTFTVSAGFQRTDYGLSDKYQSNTSFSCDSYSIGLGGAINVSKNVKVNLGYFWTTYSDYKKEMTAADGGYNGIAPAITGTDVYSRTNKVFGAGVDFKF